MQDINCMIISTDAKKSIWHNSSSIYDKNSHQSRTEWKVERSYMTADNWHQFKDEKIKPIPVRSWKRQGWSHSPLIGKERHVNWSRTSKTLTNGNYNGVIEIEII